jgi:hypothetical protein
LVEGRPAPAEDPVEETEATEQNLDDTAAEVAPVQ